MGRRWEVWVCAWLMAWERHGLLSRGGGVELGGGSIVLPAALSRDEVESIESKTL